MEWVSIGEPVPPALTPTQQRIKELLAQGKSISEIGRRLRMRADVVREEIFEIRKLESFMGTGKLTNQQRAAIYQAWKSGTPNKDLAAQYGVTKGAISQIVAKLKAAEAELYAAEPVSSKPSQINQEFDAAVDAMIAESKAADAEKKSMTAEIGHSEAEKDTSDTNRDTSAPEQLRRDHQAEIEQLKSKHLEQLARLQQEDRAEQISANIRQGQFDAKHSVMQTAADDLMIFLAGMEMSGNPQAAAFIEHTKKTLRKITVKLNEIIMEGEKC